MGDAADVAVGSTAEGARADEPPGPPGPTGQEPAIAAEIVWPAWVIAVAASDEPLTMAE